MLAWKILGMEDGHGREWDRGRMKDALSSVPQCLIFVKRASFYTGISFETHG
jgi:hypothetical protein